MNSVCRLRGSDMKFQYLLFTHVACFAMISALSLAYVVDLEKKATTGEI